VTCSRVDPKTSRYLPSSCWLVDNKDRRGGKGAATQGFIRAANGSSSSSGAGRGAGGEIGLFLWPPYLSSHRRLQQRKRNRRFGKGKKKDLRPRVHTACNACFSFRRSNVQANEAFPSAISISIQMQARTPRSQERRAVRSVV